MRLIIIIIITNIIVIIIIIIMSCMRLVNPWKEVLGFRIVRMSGLRLRYSDGVNSIQHSSRPNIENRNDQEFTNTLDVSDVIYNYMSLILNSSQEQKSIAQNNFVKNLVISIIC